MARTALITGVSGQDGSYLAELLLSKSYAVHGQTTRKFSTAAVRSDSSHGRIAIHHFELADRRAVARVLIDVAPDEIYLLASQSRVPPSWSDPAATLRHNTEATAVWLSTIRSVRPQARVVFASSCEVFDAACHEPCHEESPIRPATPYGTTKAAAQFLVSNFREHEGLFAASAILFNHESPRRSPKFLWAKLCRAAVEIAAGRQQELLLGNLDVVRDWGYAPEYAEALWRIANADAPDDFVIGTGVGRTVRTIVDRIFGRVGLDPGAYIRQNMQLSRSADAAVRVADPSKALRVLGWKATTHSDLLAEIMLNAWLAHRPLCAAA